MTQALEYFDHYAAASWVNNAGNPVARNINSLKALLRKWKTAEPSHGKKTVQASSPKAQQRVKEFDELAVDCARDLWDKRNDKDGFARVLRVWRDKTRDTRSADGRTVVDEALEMYRRKA